MKMRSVWMILAGMGLLALVAGNGTAEDKKDKSKPSLEEMTKLGQPGPEHKALEPLVGSWDCSVKFWVQPGQPPQESKGSGKRKWIFGNRYVEEHFEGSAFGVPFKGFGLTGYDRTLKKYATLWIDSMSTAMPLIHGTYDPDSKTFTFTGEEQSPFKDKKWKVRDVLKITDDDHHVLEGYRKADKGPEFKMMELTFTRKGK
jgi:Protein of unknown function (DUF1579)